jgi:pimeloyl-ACP methyl ester carboxylesterase
VAAASPPVGAASASPSPSASPATPTADFTFVARKACPESRFECITLAVPRDHRVADGGGRWNVTFAIQRAAKTRIGTFVVITGGPGSSGISAADSYTDAYATAITDAYDIVFLDQRGIGLSEPIQCIDAAAAFYASPFRPQVADERAAAAQAAKTFATDCLAESGVAAADLPLFATTQAAEDLEAIRAYLEVDKIHLYGESYGTQYVQYYADAHPDRIAALFLDGPVDLTIDGIDYYVEATRSADDTLVSTLDACTADKTCAADVRGGDALTAFDALARQLSAGPVAYDFTTATGATESRQLTIADLENAAFYYIYSRADREVLQRAIAAASNGNLVPLARAAYDSIGVNPDTLKAEEDPTWSDALYYAVECQDYAFVPDAGDPDARFAAWVDASQAAGIDDARLASSFFGDLPCLYWPTATTADDHPAALTDTPYPVFVLTSTTDPATPIANGMRIYSRLEDAWFFQALGGPHVIFAWGDPCPDDIVTAYLADGTMPAARITTCPGAVAAPYVPVAATRAAGYRNALDLMSSTDDQIFNTDDYLARYDSEQSLAIGCDFGGTLTYAPTDTGTKVTLKACEFTPDLPLTGTGSADDEEGTFQLRATSGADTLRYSRDSEGARSVTGRFHGRRVSQDSPG